MHAPIGHAIAVSLLLAASSAVALETDTADSLAAVDVGSGTGLRLAADVDTTGPEGSGAADEPAAGGATETPEDEAPLRQQLNDALDEVKDDGTLDDLKKKYFPAAEQPDG